MATTTVISSNVKLNGSAVAARFTTISLALPSVPVRISGHSSLAVPVSLTFQSKMNKATIAVLAAVAAKFIARVPRRTLAGYVDAVVNVGAELCKVEFEGAQTMYGFITVETGADGGRETTIVTVHPVDRLRFVASDDYLEPNT